MKMKAVNHKLMIRPKGTIALQGGKEVRKRDTLGFINLINKGF
jgi:hypothetical protein